MMVPRHEEDAPLDGNIQEHTPTSTIHSDLICPTHFLEQLMGTDCSGLLYLEGHLSQGTWCLPGGTLPLHSMSEVGSL